jgi:signal transduction histidine kinase
MQVLDAESLKQELEEAHRKIERLEQLLVETQRLATVGQLASRIAHEFNNLLQVIIGRSTEALKHDDLEQKDKALRKTAEHGQRAADIVTGLLGYSTGRQNRSGTVPADSLMEAAAALIAWDLPKDGIQLVRQYGCSAKVRVIPARIEQVLLNLILNARHAMEDRGGTLTLAVALDATPGYVALKVQDTGYGIPPGNCEMIFEPFFTTKADPPPNSRHPAGNGLGLPVARDLVRQAGGEIHVTSTLGAGSTFTVLLPIADES